MLYNFSIIPCESVLLNILLYNIVCVLYLCPKAFKEQLDRAVKQKAQVSYNNKKLAIVLPVVAVETVVGVNV